MKVQCYRNNTADKVSGIDDSRKEICLELGLSRQANVLSNSASAFYPQMTREELFIWGQFLPSFYSKNSGHWDKYDFDVIPNESLEEIMLATSLRVFMDLEIWTPKGKTTDPLVIGLVGSRNNLNTLYYMIVRWGESLKDFFEVKQEIFAKFQKNETRKRVPEIVQEHMNNYVITNARMWDRISFTGVAFRKSSCCGKELYKLKTSSERHLVCSKCGNARIKDIFYF